MPDQISVCFGSVRVATAANWTDARELLAAHISAVYAQFARTDRADRAREDELARAALAPVDGGFLVTSAPGAWSGSTRYAVEGVRGLSAGDLAYVRDYPNRHLSAWTINVKCKILSVGPAECIVRITGESLQFTRNEVRSIPIGYLCRRNGKS